MFKARGTRVLIRPTQQESVVAKPRLPVPDLPAEADKGPSNAAAEAFGLPALPVDFIDQVLAAQRGDADAIAMMREIGAMVPEDLRVSFTAYVQDLIDESHARE